MRQESLFCDIFAFFGPADIIPSFLPVQDYVRRALPVVSVGNVGKLVAAGKCGLWWGIAKVFFGGR